MELLTNAVDFVADLPDEGPVISGGFPRYHIGDKVEVNCTSKRSKPAAKLKWYINGEQADQNVVKNYKVKIYLFPCSFFQYFHKYLNRYDYLFLIEQ